MSVCQTRDRRRFLDNFGQSRKRAIAAGSRVSKCTDSLGDLINRECLLCVLFLKHDVQRVKHLRGHIRVIVMCI
jgi:hypothetical protein